MSRFLKMSAIALLSLFFLCRCFAQRGGFGGHGGLAARRFLRSGGFYGGGWGLGWYGPGWGWDGRITHTGDIPTGTAMLSATSRDSVRGSEIYRTWPKDALVYVDGGYAGTAGQLKKFPPPAREPTISNCAIRPATRSTRSVLTSYRARRSKFMEQQEGIDLDFKIASNASPEMIRMQLQNSAS